MTLQKIQSQVKSLESQLLVVSEERTALGVRCL